jgi:hypothetical protein
MKSTFMKAISRLLIISMLALPFQAQAGVIGTDQAISAATQSDREMLVSTIDRPEVTSQLQAMGLSTSTAKERIAAMTDEEVRTLAGNIDSLPAGAKITGWGWFGIVVVIGVIFYLYTKK